MRGLRWGWVAAVLACSWACEGGKSPEVDSQLPPPTGEGQPQLRVVHAALDAPAVDVYVSGRAEPIVTGLEFGAASDFLPLDPATYTLELRPSGADPGSPPVVTSEPILLESNRRTTGIAAGRLAEGLRLVPLSETFAPPQAGSGRLRVVHASPDAPAVSLDVGDDGTFDVSEVAAFGDSGAEGISLTAGQSVQLAIGAAGNRLTAFTLPEIPSEAEWIAIATGLVNEPLDAEGALGLIVLNPDGEVGMLKQNPIVYALHASPDTSVVDLFLGQRELSDNLKFGSLSAVIQLPPGIATVDVFPHQDGTERPMGNIAFSGVTPKLSSGREYLLAAAGYSAPPTEAQPGLELLAWPRAFASPGQQARVRVIHLSPDAPEIDVGLIEAEATFTPIPGLTALSFGSASTPEGSELEAGTKTIGVAPTGTSVPVASFSITAAPGSQSFVLAIGTLAPSAHPFELLTIDTAAREWRLSAVPTAAE